MTVLQFERPEDRARRDHLQRVVDVLRSTAPEIEVRFELIDPYFGLWRRPRQNVLGLVVISPRVEGHVQILPIRFDPRQQALRIGTKNSLVIQNALDYSFQAAGFSPGFEALIFRDAWGGAGHPGGNPSAWVHAETPVPIVSAVVESCRYEEQCAVTPRLPSLKQRDRRLRALAN